MRRGNWLASGLVGVPLAHSGSDAIAKSAADARANTSADAATDKRAHTCTNARSDGASQPATIAGARTRANSTNDEADSIPDVKPDATGHAYSDAINRCANDYPLHHDHASARCDRVVLRFSDGGGQLWPHRELGRVAG